MCWGLVLDLLFHRFCVLGLSLGCVSIARGVCAGVVCLVLGFLWGSATHEKTVTENGEPVDNTQNLAEPTGLAHTTKQ